MSAQSSRPTDIRMRFSLRASCTSEAASPRLTQGLQSSTRSRKASRASRLSSAKPSIPPNPDHCERAIPCPRVPASPGYQTCVTFGWRSRNSATACALAQCCRMRMGRVFIPRISRYAFIGPRIPPKLLRTRTSSSASSASRVTTTPASASPCPQRNLVALWMTASAPCSSGRNRYGVSQVASTTALAPAACAAAITAGASTMSRVGLASGSK